MCTSFAAYYTKPLYGMNFAIFETPLRLRIITGEGGISIFYLDVFINGNYLETAAMNSNGLFGNVQENISERHTQIENGDNQITMEDLFYSALKKSAKISDIEEIIGSKKIKYKDVPSINYKLHNLFADKYGNAMIVETSNGENDITFIDGKHIVLTNFAVGQSKGKQYFEVAGAGDDRYKVTYDFIRRKNYSFKLEDGFEILKRTHQDSSLCSMMFDPLELEIFLCFNMDFSRTWKVKLLEKSMETYSGFDRKIRFNLNANGVINTELQRVT